MLGVMELYIGQIQILLRVVFITHMLLYLYYFKSRIQIFFFYLLCASVCNNFFFFFYFRY